MLIKMHEGTLKQLDEKGHGVAVIATLGVVDKDGDVTQAGAFGEQTVPMVFAHDWKQPAIGKAKIREANGEALAEFKLNLKTERGKEVYEALRFDLDNPPARQQWSYGFTIPQDGTRRGELDGQAVRYLKHLAVHEISPVLLGAGLSTRTVAMKQRLYLTVEEVEKMCPPCAEKMRAKGFTKIAVTELIKQDFTCPKPFASFQECVDRFTGDPDVEDPEALCAAWEVACGEQSASGDSGKTLDEELEDFFAMGERVAGRMESVQFLRHKDGRDLSKTRKMSAARAKALAERFAAIERTPDAAEEAARRYYDLQAKIVKGRTVTP